jgi:2-oxoisovalerate dehydrogenase E1 component
MRTIRRFEEMVLALSREGRIAGSVHLCLGQEAIPVGTMAALGEEDLVLSTYRGHGWALATGADITEVLAEIAQKAGGTNGGRAGSPLLSNPDTGFLGENSIVGAGYPIAAGVGLSGKLLEQDRVVVSSVGDGAMNQGATTEGMIFAAARSLPVIFICENNGWAEMTPQATTTRNADLAERAAGLGIESRIVDGGDPFAVREAVAAAAAACRAGAGPVFLECKTVRLGGHYNRDIEHYRPKDDIARARGLDPLLRLRDRAISEGILAREEFDAVDEEVDRLIDRAAAAVESMQSPDPATVFEHLYGVPDPESGAPEDAVIGEPKEVTYQRAANLALATELERRPEMLVYGEDVGYAGGIFGVTRGLQKKYGDRRVFDTPISESAILGSAVGAAMTGATPVVEIMWADFVFVALDQIVNQAANVRYINRSRLSAPLTIRMQQGVTPGCCAQHAQSIEAFLAHIPGIKVGLPATAQDAYDMLRAAIADPDPVVVIEARSLYQEPGWVDPNSGLQAAEGARLHREGHDLTIITWGAMLHKALAAADALAEIGVRARVLDLRWLRPLDEAAIADCVAASDGRILIVHEATTTGGFGAELSARIHERNSGRDLFIRRLGTPDVRMPSAPTLQEAALPSVERIVDEALQVAGRGRSDHMEVDQSGRSRSDSLSPAAGRR